MKLFQCIIHLSIIVVALAQWESIDPENDNCETPLGTPGTCIQILSCKYIIDILTKSPRPLPPATVQMLQRHSCGFEGNSPKVCCPINPSTSAPSTTPPVTTSSPGIPPDVSSHPNLRLINSPQCGPVAIDRIVGGNVTLPFEYPWMALIAYNTKNGLDFRCGGTLINENYILTAAHCITSLQAGVSLVGVRVGEHNIRTEKDCDPINPEVCAPPVQDFTITEIISHPQYSSTKLENDIGLLRLSAPANMDSEAVRPICLPTGALSTETLLGKNVIVSGWGATETGNRSPVLLKVDLPIVSTEECKSRYKQANIQINIGVKQYCAGGVLGKDSCSGDSGGPLISDGSTQSTPGSNFVQFGIVSFGPKFCGNTGQPAVYTRISYYMDWILDNIKP